MKSPPDSRMLLVAVTHAFLTGCAGLKASLKQKLEAHLQETGDPRARGLSPWDASNLDKPPFPK